jgi:hypothetical protein
MSVIPYTLEGRDSVTSAYLWYLSHGYGPDKILPAEILNPGDSAYVIVLTWIGLDSLCTNLTETLVYSKGCYSYLLAEHWNAMTFVGFTNKIASARCGFNLPMAS